MNWGQAKELEAKLDDLCKLYKVPKKLIPSIDFCPHSSCGAGEDWVGFYNETFNEIWMYSGLDWDEAIKTLQHEFGHFILRLRDPKRKYHKGEERICKMMERTLIKFPHLTKTSQKSLDVFCGSR